MQPDSVAHSITSLIAGGEGLTTVFARRTSAAYINERRVIELMACMANADGGTLLIGVDRDGTVSGCHPFHGDRTDPELLASTIFRHTSPGLSTIATVTEVDGREIVAIETAAASTPVATSWGSYRTRRLNAHGKPECVGMEPSYLFTRYRDANGMDWTLVPAGGASSGGTSGGEDSALDADAIEAFRSATSDERLAQLDDAALVRALGFLDDSAEPVSLGAIAMFGTPEALRKHLPHHHLVIADRRGTPRTIRSSAPLALMLADLQRNQVTLGPAYPLVVNALIHRDYFQPGPVYVALDNDSIRVSSPGGAPRGVDLQRAAVTPVYAPRSLYLTTAVARMGVTGGNGGGLSQVAAVNGGVSFEGSHDQAVVATVDTSASAAGASVPAPNASAPAGTNTTATPQGLTANEAKAFGGVKGAGAQGASSSEIAQMTGLSAQQSYRALKKLLDKGLISKSGETRMTRYHL